MSFIQRRSPPFKNPLALPATGPIKTINGLAIGSVKTINGLAIASVKRVDGLSRL